MIIGFDILNWAVHDQVGTKRACDQVTADVGSRPGGLYDTVKAPLVVMEQLLEVVGILALQGLCRVSRGSSLTLSSA